jgi:hypothetical protein
VIRLPTSLQRGKRAHLAGASVVATAFGITLLLGHGQVTLAAVLAEGEGPVVGLLDSQIAWGVILLAVGLVAFAGVVIGERVEQVAFGVTIGATVARALAYLAQIGYSLWSPAPDEVAGAVTGFLLWAWATWNLWIATGDRRRGLADPADPAMQLTPRKAPP